MAMTESESRHSRALPLPPLSPGRALALRQVDEYHLWRPEDGGEAIVAKHGFNALLLVGLDRAALDLGLRCDTPRHLYRRPDGLLLLVDSKGHPRRSAGVLALPYATLRFAGMDAVRLS